MVSIREWRSYQVTSGYLQVVEQQMKERTRSRVVNSDVVFGPPPILGGEEVAYDELFGRVYAAIKPANVIGEMLIADAVSSEGNSYAGGA
jgi:hypothetical protein